MHAALGHEQRHTVGARLWRVSGGWDYDWEALEQFGRFGSGGIEAWGISTNTGYNFSGASWHPRLGLKTAIASGDSGDSGRDLGTLNPLFASLHYFGEEGVAGPSNFYDLRPEFEFHPRRNVRVSLNSDWFWRHRLNDGIYFPGPILLVRPKVLAPGMSAIRTQSRSSGTLPRTGRPQFTGRTFSMDSS